MELIAEGAEAKIFKTKFDSQDAVIKERIKKNYRLPEIDSKLRKERTSAEARLIRAAERAGIPCPAILEENKKDAKLTIEFIAGQKVRDFLEDETARLASQGKGRAKFFRMPDAEASEHKENPKDFRMPEFPRNSEHSEPGGSREDTDKIKTVCEQAGSLTAKMHFANIIHGDLTTSNMILKDEKIYFIDFGLGEQSLRAEDKAVDLHLFKECLVSKHHLIWKTCWLAFEAGYKSVDEKKANEILERLKVVEARGRYKGFL